jgi:hypothetical protein
MKTKIIFCGLAVLLLVGCSKAAGTKEKDFTPIENGSGFGYVTHVSGFTDRSLSEGLLFQDSKGNRTRVWPYLQMIWGDNIQVTNNFAFFVGGIAHVYKEDGVERLSDRLMAFEAPAGPPMDITDQVLKKYCAESSVAFTNVVKDSFVSLTKTNDALKIEFCILKRDERASGDITIHGTTNIISWRDIEAIMQDVKQNGKLKKEKRSGTEYLQKD